MSDDNGKKVVFLDRDGTINVDDGSVYKVEHWKWTARAIEALKQLKDAGYALVVVTNQTGIGAGYYTLEDMTTVHEHMKNELLKEGITLDFVAYCPHYPEGPVKEYAMTCDCRKPLTGMAKQAEDAIGPINYEQSWMIGDKIADLTFGKTLGMKTTLIKSSYWKDDELLDRPDIIADSLFDATQVIRNNT